MADQQNPSFTVSPSPKKVPESNRVIEILPLLPSGVGEQGVNIRFTGQPEPCAHDDLAQKDTM